MVTVPSPSSEEIYTCPPTFSIFFLTTSMPTPLPENSVTTSFVENPGNSISWRISFFVYSLSGLVNRPFSLADAKIFSGFMPRPSSAIVMITSLPVCCALSVIFAFSDLPRARRSLGSVSIPWSIEFLTMCIIGSCMLSTIVLSISVSAPIETSSTFLLSF